MITKLVSLFALGATVVPCLFYFGGMIDHSSVRTIALVGTIVWFVATPLWMGRQRPADTNSD